jgi:hypothetical protein
MSLAIPSATTKESEPLDKIIAEICLGESHAADALLNRALTLGRHHAQDLIHGILE